MKLFRITLSIILFVFLFSPALFAQNKSPEDLVKEWMQVYGVDFDKASELTTLNFWEGRLSKAKSFCKIARPRY